MNRPIRDSIRFAAAALAVGTLTVGCATEGPAGLPGAPYAEATMPPVFDHHAGREVVVVGGGEAAEPPMRVEPSAPSLEHPDVVVESPRDGFGLSPRLPRVDPPAAPALDESAPSPAFKRFDDGAICTLDAFAWGAECDTTGACLWTQSFAGVFPDGLTVGRGDHRLTFTAPEAIVAALPGMADAAPLAQDLEDPAASSTSRLASEVAALALNLGYDRAGKMGTASFGQARVNHGPFAHWTVLGVYAYAERALSEPGFLADAELDAETIADEVAALNAAGRGCRASDQVRPAQ